MQEGIVSTSGQEIGLLFHLQLILGLFRSLQGHFCGREVHLIIGIDDEIRLHQEVLQILMQYLQSLAKGHLVLLFLQAQVDRLGQEWKSEQVFPFDPFLGVHL
jgi:hypothetical protein